MSELTLTVVRLGLLALLWVFVFSIVGVLRGDLYGTRVLTRRKPGKLPGSARGPVAKPSPSMRRAAATTSHGSRRHVPSALTVTAGSMTGTTVSLRATGILLGRNPECTLVLDDDFASGRHARIFREDDGWLVEDLGSTNGTFLGANRLTKPTPVQVGSTLRIGKTIFELRK